MAKVKKISWYFKMKTVSARQAKRGVIFQDFTHSGNPANRAHFDRQYLDFFETCELQKISNLRSVVVV